MSLNFSRCRKWCSVLMDDKVDLCDLHGVVLNCEESNDPGYFGDNLSVDDVFIGEGIAEQNIDKVSS